MVSSEVSVGSVFELQLVVSVAVLAVWSLVRCQWVVCLSYSW